MLLRIEISLKGFFFKNTVTSDCLGGWANFTSHPSTKPTTPGKPKSKQQSCTSRSKMKITGLKG